MRRPALLLLFLLAPACTNKRAAVAPASTRPVTAVPTERGDLVGLGVEDVTTRLGQPALQVREGDSLKLQFRGQRCVLDAYFYRATVGQGALRVVHVDARDKDGRERDTRSCLNELAGP